MKTFTCHCGQTLFAANTECSACGRLVGWCDACGRLTSVGPDGACDYPDCGGTLRVCPNRAKYEACTGLVVAGDPPRTLCRCCRRSRVIPDTSNAQHVRQWRLLERAKRRLLYDLRLVGFDDEFLDGEPPLVFEFKSDTPEEHVVTGHADGVITINLAEADPVEREKARQEFGEPHRTLIGHLRHEFGHYWWMRQIEPQREDEFRDRFGDHNHPPYGDAMAKYYEHGPPEDWRETYISEYASSHPWEDFAETSAFYLDAMAMLDTLRCQFPPLAISPDAPLADQLACYFAAGISLNELSRTMGLTDLVPEVVSATVMEKLAWVHATRPGNGS
jgi:hypothetical protein